MNQSVEKPFYETIKEHLSDGKPPVTIVHTKISFDKNEGGERNILENQVVGPLKKNMNARFMIGLKDVNTEEIRHIYLHTITEIITAEGEHIKLVL